MTRFHARLDRLEAARGRGSWAAVARASAVIKARARAICARSLLEALVAEGRPETDPAVVAARQWQAEDPGQPAAVAARREVDAWRQAHPETASDVQLGYACLEQEMAALGIPWNRATSQRWVTV